MKTRGQQILRFFQALAVATILFVGFVPGVHAAATTESHGAMQTQQSTCPSSCVILPEANRPDRDEDEQPQPDKVIPAFMQFAHIYAPKKIAPSASYSIAAMRPPDRAMLSVLRF